MEHGVCWERPRERSLVVALLVWWNFLCCLLRAGFRCEVSAGFVSRGKSGGSVLLFSFFFSLFSVPEGHCMCESGVVSGLLLSCVLLFLLRVNIYCFVPRLICCRCGVCFSRFCGLSRGSLGLVFCGDLG